MNSAAETVSAPRDAWSVAQALFQLTKPGVTRLVMVTTLCGALIAPGAVELTKLIVALVGTALVVGAANSLNMYLERDTDRLMERTRTRPLPSGRLAPEVALWFGVLLAVVSLPVLALTVNPMTALLAALALVSYVLVYTPMKRLTPWALYMGALPGAIPPVIGWASTTGTLTLGAASLFAILFVWQLPHFLAIAIFRQHEYERAGLRVLPAVKGLGETKAAIVAFSFLLLVVSLVPAALGLGGAVYVVVAVVLGVAFAALALRGLRAKSGAAWARSLFFASMPYLVLVFGALVIGALA
jgi:heme o synthase